MRVLESLDGKVKEVEGKKRKGNIFVNCIIIKSGFKLNQTYAITFNKISRHLLSYKGF